MSDVNRKALKERRTLRRRYLAVTESFTGGHRLVTLPLVTATVAARLRRALEAADAEEPSAPRSNSSRAAATLPGPPLLGARALALLLLVPLLVVLAGARAVESECLFAAGVDDGGRGGGLRGGDGVRSLAFSSSFSALSGEACCCCCCVKGLCRARLALG